MRGVLGQLGPKDWFLVDLCERTFRGWGMESGLSSYLPQTGTYWVEESLRCLLGPYASQLCPSGQRDPVIHPVQEQKPSSASPV